MKATKQERHAQLRKMGITPSNITGTVKSIGGKTKYAGGFVHTYENSDTISTVGIMAGRVHADVHFNEDGTLHHISIARFKSVNGTIKMDGAYKAILLGGDELLISKELREGLKAGYENHFTSSIKDAIIMLALKLFAVTEKKGLTVGEIVIDEESATDEELQEMQEQHDASLTYLADMKSADISDFIVKNLGNHTKLDSLRQALPALNTLLGDAEMTLYSSSTPRKYRDLILTITIDGKDYKDVRDITDGHSIYTDNYRYNSISFFSSKYKTLQTPRELLTAREKSIHRAELKDIKDNRFGSYRAYGSSKTTYFNINIKEKYDALTKMREAEMALLVAEALEHLRTSKLGKFVSIWTPTMQHRHSKTEHANHK